MFKGRTLILPLCHFKRRPKHSSIQPECTHPDLGSESRKTSTLTVGSQTEREKHGEFVFFLGSEILTRNDGALLLKLSHVTGKHGKPYSNKPRLCTTYSAWYNITHTRKWTLQQRTERNIEKHTVVFLVYVFPSLSCMCIMCHETLHNRVQT